MYLNYNIDNMFANAQRFPYSAGEKIIPGFNCSNHTGLDQNVVFFIDDKNYSKIYIDEDIDIDMNFEKILQSQSILNNLSTKNENEFTQKDINFLINFLTDTNLIYTRLKMLLGNEKAEKIKETAINIGLKLFPDGTIYNSNGSIFYIFKEMKNENEYDEDEYNEIENE